MSTIKLNFDKQQHLRLKHASSAIGLRVTSYCHMILAKALAESEKVHGRPTIESEEGAIQPQDVIHRPLPPHLNPTYREPLPPIDFSIGLPE